MANYENNNKQIFKLQINNDAKYALNLDGATQITSFSGTVPTNNGSNHTNIAFGVAGSTGPGPQVLAGINANGEARCWGNSAFGCDTTVQCVVGGFAIGNKTKVLANYAFAAGEQTQALGTGSVALGAQTTAEGSYSLACGAWGVKADGYGSIAAGSYTCARGTYSIAAGYYCETGKELKEGENADANNVEGKWAFAMGEYAKAEGTASIALGKNAVTHAGTSIAMGQDVETRSSNTIAIGKGLTTTSKENQVVLGQYNEQNNNGAILLVGVGSSSTERCNLLAAYPKNTNTWTDRGTKNQYLSINGDVLIGKDFTFRHDGASQLGAASITSDDVDISGSLEVDDTITARTKLVVHGQFRANSSCVFTDTLTIRDSRDSEYTTRPKIIISNENIAAGNITIDSPNSAIRVCASSANPPKIVQSSDYLLIGGLAGTYGDTTTRQTVLHNIDYSLLVGNGHWIQADSGGAGCALITGFQNEILIKENKKYFYPTIIGANNIIYGEVKNNTISHCGTIIGYHNRLNVTPNDGSPLGATVLGKHNTESNPRSYIFSIGTGTDDAADKRNTGLGFTTTNHLYLDGSVQSAKADYAEMFEWLDLNPLKEDRVGYLVSLSNNKITLCNQNSKPLGIVSGTAAVVGDSAGLHWKDKYLTDEFGRIIYDEVEEFCEVPDETTGQIIKESCGMILAPRINPNYNPNEPYVSRDARPEWATIGLMGKLYTRDDGTCVPGGYGKPADGGILTHSDEETQFYIMERSSDNVVLVFLK